MHYPSLFVTIVYISGYMSLVFCAICLACGLYYCVELAEEHTSLTRRLIQAISYLTVVVHVLLYAYEKFPAVPCATGVVAHASYLGLLRTYPFFALLSPQALLAIALFALDNYAWFTFFSAEIELFYSYRVAPAPAILAFFLLVVWCVPLVFFITLSVNDSVLPTAGQGAAYAAPHYQGALNGDRKKSRNFVASILEAAGTRLKNGIGVLAGQAGRGGADILSDSGHRNY